MSALFAWIGILVLGLMLLLNIGTGRITDPDCLVGSPSDSVESCVDPDTGIPDPDSAAPGWTPVTVNGITGVIVAPNAVDDFGLWFGTEVETWKPTLADVQAAEDVVTQDQGELTQFRQYAGFVEDGDRKILINGFCDTFGFNWYRSVVIVMDGGDCFFQAVFNVETGELERFAFNGNA